MENRNKLHDFPRSPGFFINDHLSSRVYVIRRSPFSFLPSPTSEFRHDEVLGFDCHYVKSVWWSKADVRFIVLPFVGVVLFHCPTICCSRVVPQSNHLTELG